MEPWSVHQLSYAAKKQHNESTTTSLQLYAQRLIANNLPVIFTLAHLARITGVPYRTLRETVNRQRESANYRMYAVKKRSGGRRFIHSVSEDIFRVQKFLNQEVLQKNSPHPSSFAFHKSGGIRKCASMHCGARWLFQYDLKDFFYSVNETDVYHLFQSMGYRKLLAFEIARLCTTTRLPKSYKHRINHQGNDPYSGFSTEDDEQQKLPYPDCSGVLGVLPQGAPTSPMLSNLAVRGLDESLHEFSLAHGFIYTRYADDITISVSDIPSELKIGDIHRAIIKRIRKANFVENTEKIRIAGPGSKKVVLGLLVDGGSPRLSKETYHRIDRLLYASEKFGIVETANHEKFDSAFGFYNHLSGLISYTKDVDSIRWEKFSTRFAHIKTPWEASS